MPDAANRQELPQETAGRIVRELDTYGDPNIYALARHYLRLRTTLECLLPANGCMTVEEALRDFGDAT